jgi:hypothetical protein
MGSQPLCDPRDLRLLGDLLRYVAGPSGDALYFGALRELAAGLHKLLVALTPGASAQNVPHAQPHGQADFPHVPLPSSQA